MMDIIKALAADVMETESKAEIAVGTVTSTQPLCVKLENNLELTEQFLWQTAAVSVREETGQMTFHGETGQFQIQRDNRLSVGERVVLAKQKDGQHYIILDRLQEKGW